MVRKLMVMALGWVLLVGGAILCLTPVPVPLIGVVPLLTGCALLSAHSKGFRRRLQRLRHRFEFLSQWLDRFVHRAPKLVKVMIHRTRPHALRRHARLRRRRDG
jgi:hypothetical protein